MVTYTINDIQSVIRQVPKIGGRPNFTSLWGLKQVPTAGLKKIKNVDHTNNGHEGYLKSDTVYSLIPKETYDEAEDVGESYNISATSITETSMAPPTSPRTSSKIAIVAANTNSTVIDVLMCTFHHAASD